MKSCNLDFSFLGGLVLTLCSVQALGLGAPGKVEGFKLRTCGEKQCLEITAPTAFVGALDGSFGIELARIKVTSRVSQKIVIINSNDVYLDFSSRKVFMRDINEHPRREAYYDLSEETLHFLAVEDSTLVVLDHSANPSGARSN